MKSLTKEERRVVARRLFEALCAHYPDRYIALVERPERAKLTIVGGTATLPAGVRRALVLPHQLTVELAHLGRLVARQPARADLAARAANLRARLSDSAALLRAKGFRPEAAGGPKRFFFQTP